MAAVLSFDDVEALKGAAVMINVLAAMNDVGIPCGKSTGFHPSGVFWLAISAAIEKAIRAFSCCAVVPNNSKQSIDKKCLFIEL